MTRNRPLTAFAVLACVFAFNAMAQSLLSTGTRAVATYESVGLYWANPGGTAGCDVRYRKSGTAAWSQGLAMWYDARDTECRGSLVHLSPDTQYDVEMGLAGQAMSRALTFRTWANQRPVAKTITVASGSATLNVTEGGSASGYVVYQGAAGATLDGQNSVQYNVTINASYVIVRGLNLRGAKQDAIRISPTATDVIIEDNDISGWGRLRSGNWGVDMDSAIRAVCTTPSLQRVTIQRNKMYNPRYSANSWSDGHPAGPQAISFSHCGGNHVFRHNDAYSTNGNYFNDIFGGEDNFTKAGFPNSDTDIYGNKLSHGWDDAIEAEGANENVRIWGNYIDRTAIGVATTATSVGPAYIFRNVWNRSQFYERTALDSDDRQPFFKSGGTSELGHGRRYIMHNTMLQARQSGLANGLGGGFGLGGTGSAQLIENTWSRNNVYHQWKEGKGFTYQTGSSSSFVSDMYNGHAGDATVTNGIVGTPAYLPGHGWVSEAGGNYALAATSPGHDRGVRIPNFNDAFTGAAPDVGAHESNTASMQFGISGSPGPSVAGSSTPPAPSTYVLSISKAGTGSGTVTATSGINCGSSCSSTLPSGTAVTFTAAAASGSSFAGWSGACAGTGQCTITVTSTTSVAATFNASGGGAGTAGLSNISTRGQVRTGNDVMIGGFIIGGTSSKTVVIRARGPSLTPLGVPNALADPSLQLVRSSDQATLAINDNWGSNANAAQLQASGFAPSHALESALLVSLAPGAYTAIVAGVGNTSGVGMIEVFELDNPTAPLANLSTRGQVLTGGDVMIGGFIVRGTGPQTVVVRARGPSLVPHGITNALANPMLQLVRSSDQATIAVSDNWGSAANAAQLSATGFAPQNGLEAAILITLQPGAYTAIVTGAAGGTGVGMVEVFTVN
jgi:hypothetical protein